MKAVSWFIQSAFIWVAMIGSIVSVIYFGLLAILWLSEVIA